MNLPVRVLVLPVPLSLLFFVVVVGCCYHQAQASSRISSYRPGAATRMPLLRQPLVAGLLPPIFSSWVARVRGQRVPLEEPRVAEKKKTPAKSKEPEEEKDRLLVVENSPEAVVARGFVVTWSLGCSPLLTSMGALLLGSFGGNDLHISVRWIWKQAVARGLIAKVLVLPVLVEVACLYSTFFNLILPKNVTMRPVSWCESPGTMVTALAIAAVSTKTLPLPSRWFGRSRFIDAFVPPRSVAHFTRDLLCLVWGGHAVERWLGGPFHFLGLYATSALSTAAASYLFRTYLVPVERRMAGPLCGIVGATAMMVSWYLDLELRRPDGAVIAKPQTVVGWLAPLYMFSVGVALYGMSSGAKGLPGLAAGMGGYLGGVAYAAVVMKWRRAMQPLVLQVAENGTMTMPTPWPRGNFLRGVFP